MKIINLTPHALQLHGLDGPDDRALNIPPSGSQARLAVTRTPAASVEVGGVSLSVNRPTMGDVTGLPAPAEGVIYVASALVAEKAQRGDVFAPGELIRDAAGNVIGAKGLTTYSP